MCDHGVAAPLIAHADVADFDMDRSPEDPRVVTGTASQCVQVKVCRHVWMDFLTVEAVDNLVDAVSKDVFPVPVAAQVDVRVANCNRLTCGLVSRSYM